jgi:hypothetical protein
VKRVGFTLLITLVCAILGVWLASLWANGPLLSGKWVRWKSLGSPPEKPAAITGGVYCDDRQGVEVQAASGNVYQHCGRTWSLVGSGPANATFPLIPCQGEVPSAHNPGFGSLPSPVTTCSWTYAWEWTTEELVIVALEDGSVWSWYYSFGVGTVLLTSLAGLLAGLVAGIFIAQILWKLIIAR